MLILRYDDFLTIFSVFESSIYEINYTTIKIMNKEESYTRTKYLAVKESILTL